MRSLLWAGIVLVFLTAVPSSEAQIVYRWLSAGSLHNFYANIGNECENCFVNTQQYGLRWPASQRLRDNQAYRGMWIGAKNVRDAATGQTFERRVVHAGPRVSGIGEFFPVRHETITRFEVPTVLVDGVPTLPEAEMVVDRVDPDLDADAMIYTEVNSLLGLTMKRRIRQFTNEFHDNYHVIEFTFINTGNVDEDPEIELPNQTLEDVYFTWMWRWSMTAETRYIVDNSSGWGKNTMNDARGDGLAARFGDSPADSFRAVFAWHGYHPDKQISYNNIGAPILRENVPVLNIAADDTLGRLGASAFVGAVVLHADTSPSNRADDRSQPSGFRFFDSDSRFLSGNNAFSAQNMFDEYEFIMTRTEVNRHGFRVVNSDDPRALLQNTPETQRAPWEGQPSDLGPYPLVSSGGKASAINFGPYTLAPGDSIRIVLAEAAAGLSWEANKSIGEAYKAAGAQRDQAQLAYRGQSMTKNEWVFTSRDSLFQTFHRAIANYRTNFSAPRAPKPPSQLSVNGGGDRISIEWDIFQGETPDAFEVYRAQSRVDEDYVLIHTAPGTARRFDDLTATRGINYFYYVQAVKRGASTGTALTPSGDLRSSRYFGQTFAPTQLKRPAGRALDEIRVVPNPFYLGAPGGSSSVDSPRFFDQTDKLAFYNIPGLCRIEIFTELGEKIGEINHTDGSGDTFWDHTTASRQLVASGVYIAVITVTEDITDNDTGETLFRAGDSTFRKFVIIR